MKKIYSLQLNRQLSRQLNCYEQNFVALSKITKKNNVFVHQEIHFVKRIKNLEMVHSEEPIRKYKNLLH